MYTIEPEGEFYIKGRGTVFTTRSPVACPRSLKGFKRVVGQHVIINKSVYSIEGLECFGRPGDIWEGEALGLLVKKVKNNS